MPILRPITNSDNTIQNSFGFAKHMSTIIFDNHVIMASSDIQSLFTNKHLKETIDIFINKLFENNGSVHNITKDQFKKLSKLSVEGSTSNCTPKLMV